MTARQNIFPQKIPVIYDDLKAWLKSNFSSPNEFPALKTAIEQFQTDNGQIFYTRILPGIVALAKSLDQKCIKKKLGEKEIELNRKELGSIWANQFLGTGKLIKRNAQDGLVDSNAQIFNEKIKFENWFSNEKKECAEMVLHLICFFKILVEQLDQLSSNFLEEKVTFKICNKELLGDPVENPHKRLEYLTVDRRVHSKHGNKTAKVVFVENKSIGEKLFCGSCFQEEIELVTRPELILAVHFGNLTDSEAMVVTGAKKYTWHQGFGETFRFVTAAKGEEANPVVFVKTTILDQYEENAVKKDLASAFAGFAELPYVDNIVFEFWGWSDTMVPFNYPAERAVVADPALKIMTMWVAAAMAFKCVIFRQNIFKTLGREVEKLEKEFQQNTIGEAYEEIKSYCKYMLSDPLPIKNKEIKDQKIYNTFTLRPGYLKIPVKKIDEIWGWLQRKMETTKNTHSGYTVITSYNLEKVYQIYNYRLWERFLERKWEIEKGFSKSNEIKRLFHGTSAAEVISKNGFDKSRSSIKGMLGQGIYFAESSSKSTQYTINGFRGDCGPHKDTQCKVCVRSLLVCRVMHGKVHDATGPLNGIVCAPNGCDSVDAKPGTYKTLANQEMAVYNNFQKMDALPENLSSEEIEAHLYWIARKRNNSTITTSA